MIRLSLAWDKREGKHLARFAILSRIAVFLLSLVKVKCEFETFCVDPLNEAVDETTVADCRFALAHLPSFPNDPNFEADVDSSYPFLPVLRIRHRACLLGFEWSYHPAIRYTAPPFIMPEFLPEMHIAATRLLDACAHTGGYGSAFSEYPVFFLQAIRLGVWSSAVSQGLEQTYINRQRWMLGKVTRRPRTLVDTWPLQSWQWRQTSYVV